jgi:hypothetical protein
MVSHMKSNASAILLIGLLTATSGFSDLLRLNPVEDHLVPATLATGNFSAVAVDSGTGGLLAASAGGTVYSVRDEAKTPLLPLSPILALSGCLENNKGQAFAVNPQGGIDLIGRNSAGVAHSTPLVAGNHVAVASLVKPGDEQSDYSALAASAAGGINLIGWNNGWTSGNLSTDITVLDGKGVTSRSRVRFAPIEATHVRFDFGTNTSKRGLRLVELGVVGK